jgi:AraC-like DNA-binding protein
MAIRGQHRTFSGEKTAEFAHDDWQLAVAVSGAFVVSNNFGAWTVPVNCAAWIPSRFRHAIEPLPRCVIRTLYLTIRRPPSRLRRFGGSCAVLGVSPLMRAIVDHVCESGDPIADAVSTHLLAVLLDQLPRQRELPLFVPALASPLARRVADALAADPAGTPRIRDLARALVVSDRTLERAFLADVRMPLGEWRLRSRICRAIALLGGGMPVQDVALEVGYATPSAFVAAFKKYAGTTPGRT